MILPNALSQNSAPQNYGLRLGLVTRMSFMLSRSNRRTSIGKLHTKGPVRISSQRRKTLLYLAESLFCSVEIVGLQGSPAP